MMRSFAKRIIALLLTLAAVSACCPITAFAGSVTIRYRSASTGKGVSGAELTLYKVGEKAGGDYRLTADFTASGVDLTALGTAAQQEIAAAALYSYAQTASVSGAAQSSDANGAILFSGLPDGLYLAAQTNSLASYVTIKPFLIALPMTNASGTGHERDVTIAVKTERKASGGNTETKSISVKKVWDDGNDADKIRPQSVAVTLLRNGAEFKKAELSASGNWSHTFSGLPDDGTYSISEQPVDNYSASYSGSAASGFIVTNKHDPENIPIIKETEITVVKLWDDSGESGRPDSVSVELFKDGTLLKTETLSALNGWTCVFSGLESASYKVVERPVRGYETFYEVSGGRVTITNRQNSSADLVSVGVNKVWSGDEQHLESRPASVSVQLIKDAEVYQTASLSEQNNWSHVFGDLPRGDYAVREIAVSGYTASYARSGNVFTITNAYGDSDSKDEQDSDNFGDGGLSNIEVAKVWDCPQDKIPGSVVVHLISNGSVYASAVLNEQNGWKECFYHVSANRTYTIFEQAPDGFSARYAGDAAEGFVITNSYTPGTTDSGNPPDETYPDVSEGSAEISKPYDPDGALIPKTGTLRWPAPVMAFLGTALILFGIAESRKKPGCKK